MEQIRNIVSGSTKLDGNTIIKVLDYVSNNGDIMIIKSDGLRDSLKYSVIISSHENNFVPIRFDSDDLNDAVLKSLNEYVKHN